MFYRITSFWKVTLGGLTADFHVIRNKMKRTKKNKTIKFSDTISVIALLFSLPAIIVSIRSCAMSQNTLKMNSEIFENERSIVLQGLIEYNNENEITVGLLPLSKDTYLQTAKLYFPKDITEYNIYVGEHSEFKLLEWNMEMIETALEKYLTDMYLTDFGNSTGNGCALPLVIDTKYIYQNTIYYDRSYYVLLYNWGGGRDMDDKIDVSLSFTDLRFMGKIDWLYNPYAFLNDIWSKDVDIFNFPQK